MSILCSSHETYGRHLVFFGQLGNPFWECWQIMDNNNSKYLLTAYLMSGTVLTQREALGYTVTSVSVLALLLWNT